MYNETMNDDSTFYISHDRHEEEVQEPENQELKLERNENGEVIERLLLSYIPVDADVEKIGNDLFAYDGDMTIPDGEKYDIIQGCFEKSNVDANKEITALMETQRLFEASSAVLKYMDTINGRAASEIIKL